METNKELKIFIKTNSEYLRSKLVEFGIRENILDDMSYPWVAVNYGLFISVTPDFDNTWNKDHICCEFDETELFLAICAIRNNTDKDQYFITDVDVLDLDNNATVKKGSLIKSLVSNYSEGGSIPAHKASISELLSKRDELRKL